MKAQITEFSYGCSKAVFNGGSPAALLVSSLYLRNQLVNLKQHR